MKLWKCDAAGAGHWPGGKVRRACDSRHVPPTLRLCRLDRATCEASPKWDCCARTACPRVIALSRYGGNLFQAVSLALGDLLGGLPADAPTAPRMAPTRVRR